MRRSYSHSWHTKRTSALSRLLAVIAMGLMILILGCGNQHQKVFLMPQALSNVQKVAVLPFENLSNDMQASVVLAKLFATRLEQAPRFQVIRPNNLDEVLQQQKLLDVTQPFDRATLRQIGQSLGVDAIFYGAVLEYNYLQEWRDGQVVANEPVVSVMLRMVDAKSGNLLWQSVHSRSSYAMIRGNRDSIANVAEQAIEHMVQPLLRTTAK